MFSILEGLVMAYFLWKKKRSLPSHVISLEVHIWLERRGINIGSVDTIFIPIRLVWNTLHWFHVKKLTKHILRIKNVCKYSKDPLRGEKHWRNGDGPPHSTNEKGQKGSIWMQICLFHVKIKLYSHMMYRNVTCFGMPIIVEFVFFRHLQVKNRKSHKK